MHPIPLDKEHYIPAYAVSWQQYQAPYTALDGLHEVPAPRDRETPPARSISVWNNHRMSGMPFPYPRYPAISFPPHGGCKVPPSFSPPVFNHLSGLTCISRHFSAVRAVTQKAPPSFRDERAHFRGTTLIREPAADTDRIGQYKLRSRIHALYIDNGINRHALPTQTLQAQSSEAS